MEKFSRIYHTVWAIIFQIAGIIITFYISLLNEKSVSEGIVIALLFIALCTACFLIYPLFWCAMGFFVLYAPVLAFPAYLILVIGNIFGDQNEIGLQYLISSISLTAFGYFNIKTRLSFEKDENTFFLVF